MLEKNVIKKIIGGITSIAFSFVVYSTANADLLEMYSSSQNLRERSQLSYEFGVNSPVLSQNQLSGTQKIFEAKAQTEGNNSCSFLGNMKAGLSSFFNAEKMVQGLTANLQNAISAVPATLLCYANQTLCDMYKFMRNMANFSAQMNVTSCQEYEKMGIQLADSMRKKKVQQCAMEKAQSGDLSDYQQYIAECEQEVGNLPINIPGTNETAKGSYKLSDQIKSIFASDPQTTQIVSKLLGDFAIGYNVGVKQTDAPLYGEDALLSEYIQKYRNAIQDVAESYINDNREPSDEEKRMISIPGFPITDGVMNRLRLLPPKERNDFYEQYSTVAGMYALTIKIEEAMKAIDVAKNQQQDPDVRKVLQENLESLKSKYDLMYKRLALQRDFLAPMFKAIYEYSPAQPAPDIKERDLEPFIPKPLVEKQ